GQRRGGAGGDRFVLFAPRLAQVDVQVDQARADDLPGGVEGLVGVQAGLGTETEDAVAADPEGRNLIVVLGRIEDAAVGDTEGIHPCDCSGMRVEFPPSLARRANVSPTRQRGGLCLSLPPTGEREEEGHLISAFTPRLPSRRAALYRRSSGCSSRAAR